MINLFKYKFLFLFLFFVVFSSNGLAQKDVLELLPSADKLTFNEKTKIHTLSGGVKFLYEGNPFYCDLAIYNKEEKWFKAYGKVHCIYKKDINIFCDSLFYVQKKDLAKLWGNVKIRDLEYKISSDSMDYDFKRKCAIYKNNGFVESITSNESIKSIQGYIYPDSKDFYFKGEVQYHKNAMNMSSDTLRFSYKEQTAYFFGSTIIEYNNAIMNCQKGWYNVKKDNGVLKDSASVIKQEKKIYGDSIFYDGQDSLTTAYGNVIALDTILNTCFNSDKASYDEKIRRSCLSGNVCALKIREKDTVLIHSDTLLNFSDTINNKVFSLAFRNVNFSSKDIDGICDSMFLDSSVLNLYYKPILWSKNGEVKGEQINVYFLDSIIDSIHVLNDASIIFELDSGQYYNQIYGDQIKSIFENNQMSKSFVFGNAWTIIYPEEETESDSNIVIKRMGLNRLYSSDIRVDLDSGKVAGISYLKSPDGVFYPMDKINKKEKFITGFSWNAALKPKRVYCLFAQ